MSFPSTHIAKVAQTTVKRFDTALVRRSRTANQHSYAVNFHRLLRVGGKAKSQKDGA
jgi:hypothetical protein